MKKMIITISGFLFILMMTGCATDRGIYNPDEKDESNFATLYIHKNLSITEIDDERVSWTNFIRLKQQVRIAPGPHSFKTSFNDGYRSSNGSVFLSAIIEPGKEYIIRPFVNSSMVQYKILEIRDGQEIETSLDMDKLQGKGTDAIPQYIASVLNPTMDENNQSVKLENDDYILLYKPDMIFSLTEKSTGEVMEGRRGFEMDFSMTTGTTYLLETDISTMSREDFLNSNYKENAQTKWLLKTCNGSSVTYIYLKPEALAEHEITFTITFLETE